MTLRIKGAQSQGIQTIKTIAEDKERNGFSLEHLDGTSSTHPLVVA